MALRFYLTGTLRNLTGNHVLAGEGYFARRLENLHCWITNNKNPRGCAPGGAAAGGALFRSSLFGV